MRETYEELQTKFQEQRQILLEKEALVDRLENNNRDLEVKMAKLQAEKKTVEQRQIQNTNSAELQSEKIQLLTEQNSEMRSEIEVLLTQCKESQNQINSREGQIKQQTDALQQIYNEIQTKDAEIQKREDYIGRLTRQLEDKKGQLHNANLKLRQYSRTVVNELNAKIAEKDKEVKILKEMVKGHHAEVKAKNKDIMRLKHQLKRAIKGNEMKKEFIKTFVKPEDEEQAKQIKKMEQYDINEVSGESDEEGRKNDDLERDESKSAVIEKKSPPEQQDVSLPSIAVPSSKDQKSSPPYRENYLKRLENYYQQLGDARFHNNSYNMQGLLSHNFNAFQEIERKKSNSLEEKILYTPNNEKRKGADLFEVKMDVDEIIAQSLGAKVPSSVNLSRAKDRKIIKFGNLPSANLISPVVRKKGRNNSKT